MQTHENAWCLFSTWPGPDAQNFEALETGQRLTVTLLGEPLQPRLALSNTTLNFGDCAQYDHRELELKLTNQQEEPFSFSFTTCANYSVKPTEGRIPPGGTAELIVSFRPHQLGTLRGSMQVLGFGGAVYSKKVQLLGVCSAPAKRTPAGGIDKLPEDFEEPLKLVERNGLIGGDTPLSTWTRTPLWEATASYEDANLTVLQALRKRKTYAAQQAGKQVLDTVDRMDTGLEITVEEQRAIASHRDYYADFLKAARADREAAKSARRHAVGPGSEECDLGLDLGLDAYCGLTCPFPELPKEREGLWLSQPCGDGAEGLGGLTMFDQTRLFPRKLKAKPETPDEVRDCKLSLSPKELLAVVGGPKTIDFGTVSVFTTVPRNFTVMNDLRQSVLVSIELGGEEELEQSTPLSQVIPPGASAGFDIVFVSAEPCSYRRTIKYVINGVHAFKFTAVAEVVPIELGLSTEELSFHFPDGSLQQSMTMPVTLTNSGTHPAAFSFVHPEAFKGVPAFVPHPAEGVLAPRKSLVVDVRLTPYLGAQSEHVLTAVVEGGPSKPLFCRAELAEAKAVVAPKSINFGPIAAGVSRERTFLVRNAGTTEAVFAFEEPPAGIELRPMVGCARPGGSCEVVAEVTADSSQIIDAKLVAAVRCGRSIKLELRAEAVVPDVDVAEDEFDFGAVVVGATSTLPLTLRNRSNVAAVLHCDLTEHAEFEIALPPDYEGGPVAAGEEDAGPLVLLPPSMAESPIYGEAAADERRPVSRVYAIRLAPSAELVLELSYSPGAVRELVFELPIAPAGLSSQPGMRRAVCGEGIKPRLQLSETVVKLGERILRNIKFPHTHEVTVTNADVEPLAWSLDEAALPTGCAFSLKPTPGELGVGESTIVRIAFAPEEAGPVNVSLPLHIGGGGERPYLHLVLSGTAALPRLSFDVPAVNLLAVPLGHTARASFHVINEGYDNLQIQHRLPIDSSHMPVDVAFPEGTLVGVSRQRLMLAVAFTAKKPTAFTAPIDLVDTDGNCFSINVTCTTDNSLLTLQPFLAAPRAAPLAWRVDEGKPLIAEPAPAPVDGETIDNASSTLLLPAAVSDDTLAAASEEVRRSAHLVLAYVLSAVSSLPGLADGTPFPAMLCAARAAPTLELLAMLSGKPVPMPDAPADRKSEKQALRHAVACGEAMLAFLRAHGAMLATVNPEHLLPIEEYVRLGKMAGRPKATLVREHGYKHPEAWLEVVLQLVKTFVLGRVTARSFKVLPGVGPAAAEIARDPTLSASNVYSAPEGMLLRWLAHHWAAVDPESAAGARLVAFDAQLRDGHVFAAVLLSHAPFLATGGAIPPAGGAPIVGSSIDTLHPQPCSPEQCVSNLQLVLDNLGLLGIPYVGLGAVRAPQLYAAAPRELLLFTLYLYQSMPHYVPKTTVSFKGGLQKLVVKTIELANPAKKPIAYEVRLTGAGCFKVGATQVRLEPKATLSFPVECLSNFMGVHAGRLIFLSQSSGSSMASANTLVFELAASIEMGAPMESATISSKLYVPAPMPVTITNPFDETATLCISLTEQRPELGGSGASGAGAADDRRGSVAGAGLRGSARAAEGAKLAKLGGAMTSFIGDDLTKRLPSTFWCASEKITLEPRASVVVPFQFLPFQLGDYVATVLFADEVVGEFSYELRGESTMPLPLEPITLVSEADSSASKEVLLPFRNPQAEKARQAVLDRSVREKEKMSNIWGKEPLFRGPISMALSFSSSFFSANSATLDMHDTEKRRGGRMSTGASAANSRLATPRSGGNRDGGDSVVDGGGGAVPADANKLLVRFVPNEPGQYTGELMMVSPYDVRIYSLSAACTAPGLKAALEFVSPARLPVQQELPIINGSDVDWSVSASLKGEGFSGPPSVKVSAGSTGHYPLEFCADWMCEREGELTLTNQNTGDKYHFSLHGVGEEPLAESHVVLECAARQPRPLIFNVFNVSASGEACELTVDSDLMHISGPASIEVPARGKRASGAAETRQYELQVNPQMGGTLQGSLSFTAPDGRYLWYTVELNSSPPPAESLIDISAPLRKVVAVEIPISNPASDDLEFAVYINGEALLGDEAITVAPGATAMYELLYSPLRAGVTHGSVAFVNPVAGEFWYELRMTAEEPTPVELPLLRCSVGGKATHAVPITNPVGEELVLTLRNDNARNYSLTGPEGKGLVLPPYGDIEAQLTFTPSAIEEEHRAVLVLTHPKLGELVYHARGVGHFPRDDMPLTEVTAPLGQTGSSTISFHNPFGEPLELRVEMDTPPGDEAEAPPRFELLARRTSGLAAAPYSVMQLPVAFFARDMDEQHARLMLHSAYKGTPLSWTFPLVGVAVSRPLPKPISLRTAARQPLRRELQLPIPGLLANAVEEGFTYDLDVAADDADFLARTLTVSPMERTLSGPTLRMALDWRPLRPARIGAALVVRKQSGGRWRYDLALEAGEPEHDDVIHIEAAMNKTAAVSFRLGNAFDTDVPFQAFFTPESPSVFSATPASGVLPRAGTAGTIFTVSYTPIEYGKAQRGTFVILTDEMQWSYDVRGSHPQYVQPAVQRDTSRLLGAPKRAAGGGARGLASSTTGSVQP